MRFKIAPALIALVLLALLALISAGPSDESGCPKLSSEAEFDSFVQVLCACVQLVSCYYYPRDHTSRSARDAENNERLYLRAGKVIVFCGPN